MAIPMTEDPAPPSPLRLPLSLVLGVTAPPLGLVAWILLSGSRRAVYLQSPWVRAGGAIFLAGAIPLLGVIVATFIGLWPDPNPNPVGLGFLFLAAGVLGCLLALIGVIRCETS
jgi:hypothetical protein